MAGNAVPTEDVFAVGDNGALRGVKADRALRDITHCDNTGGVEDVTEARFDAESGVCGEGAVEVSNGELVVNCGDCTYQRGLSKNRVFYGGEVLTD